MCVTTNEEQAFSLLQWVPYSLAAEFDEDLAAQGYYTKLQRQRSDQALKAFDKEHQYECSNELSAFRELERLGVFSQSDFFSPSQAKNGFYTKRLKQHHTPIPSRDPEPEGTGEDNCDQGAGEQLAAFNAQRRFTRKRRARRKGFRS